MDNNNTEAETICRACGEPTTSKISLFVLKYEQIYMNQIFRICTSIHVDKNSPSTICESCLKQLLEVYRFIKKCHQTDTNLRNQQSTHFVKIEVGDNVEESKVNIHDLSGDNSTKVPTLDQPPPIVQVTIKSDDLATPPPRYRCKFCFFPFDNFSKYASHLSTHPSPRSKKSPRREKTYKPKTFECEICLQVFKYFTTLKYHRMLHTGEAPHMCDVCGKRFIQKVSLQEHKKIHTGETPHVCSYCKRGFRSATSYKSHVAIHYSTEDPVPCGVCDKVLRSKSAWKKHQLTHNKSFLCSVCGKKFVNKTMLTEHGNIHTGVKPYICKFCAKSFFQKRQLTLHLQRHQAVRPYPCDKCNKGYITRYKLRVHQSKAHPT